MIFVDTSVWIEFFRRRPSSGRSAEEHRHLRDGLSALLDDDQVGLAVPVRIELVSGVKKEVQSYLARLLAAIPTHLPAESTWQLIETWALTGAAAGHHFGVGDLLVAAIAAEHAAPVWSLDPDFARLASLGFGHVYEPGHLYG